MQAILPIKIRTSKAVRTFEAAEVPWSPDLGNGEYRNPIIHADYSDPDVIRVGNDFYLTASSFNCVPGLPILHSRDLVNWKIINHALPRLPHSRYDDVQLGCGVWAPAMRFHAGKFWIFFPMPDEGIFVTTTDHPANEWSKPHLVQEGRGLIDPCPFWDDDGHAYLVHAYAKSRSGMKHMLRVCPMSSDGSRLLGEGEIVFYDPERHPTLEGPKVLKRDNWYYILAPAGGVETGYQVALRAKNIYGPYEDKIVLEQGNTEINGPHQGALVDTPSGGWWFVHFQDAGVYGRIVHLQPVHWNQGWPMMGARGTPVSQNVKPLSKVEEKICVPQTDDNFDGGKLGLQWQWPANPRDNWLSLSKRPGWLRLYPQRAHVSFAHQPNLLLQKLPSPQFTVETELDLLPMQCGEEAGLVITGESYASLGLLHDGAKNKIIFREANRPKVIFETRSNVIKLRVRVSDKGACQFSFENKNGFEHVSTTFKAQKGVWIGAKVGLYAIKQVVNVPAGHADFKYFVFI